MKKAAELGDAESQYFVGLMYQDGLGAIQSPTQAYVWFSIATAGGLLDKKDGEDAMARRDQMAATLTPDQLRDARREARKLLDKIERRKK